MRSRRAVIVADHSMIAGRLRFDCNFLHIEFIHESIDFLRVASAAAPGDLAIAIAIASCRFVAHLRRPL